MVEGDNNENLDIASKGRFRIAMALFLLSIIVVLLAIFLSLRLDNNESRMQEKYGKTLAVSYLEDLDGELTFTDVLQAVDSHSQPLNWEVNSKHRTGSSRSVWWVRIKSDDLLSIKSLNGDQRKYLSLPTSSVERVDFYIPILHGDRVSYELKQAGWGIPYENHDNIVFSYPIFLLEEEIPSGHYAFLRLTSPYTQNYGFKIYNESSFRKIERIHTTMVALFIGFMMAVGISNFIQLSTLHITARLCYILYLLTTIVYSGSVLGFFRLYIGELAETLVENISPAGIFMMISALLFFQAILDTKVNFPLAHKASIGAILLFLLTFLAFQNGLYYEANLATLLLANSTSLLIIATTYLATRRKFSHAKYLLAGLSLILMVSLIFNARAIGLLPNNEFTSFIILFPTLIEALLLSIAMSEMTDQIQRDKEHALMLYQLAEIQVLIKESAFLQAQIKPHFFYNTLNIIEALCYIDGKKAGQLIQELSIFLRHSFDFRNLNTYIDFKEELDYVKAYVKIEQARFPNKINLVYDLEEEEGLTILPLLLQPLIENAIKHGIMKLGRAGRVIVQLRVFENAYRIVVEDDGVGMTEDQLASALSENLENRDSVGLANINKRLKMFYQTELKIESRPGKGTKVTVEIPIKREDKN